MKKFKFNYDYTPPPVIAEMVVEAQTEDDAWKLFDAELRSNGLLDGFHVEVGSVVQLPNGRIVKDEVVTA